MRIITLFILMLSSFTLYAQQGNELKGRIVNSVTSNPVSGVSVDLMNQNLSAITDGEGRFEFKGLLVSKDELVISATDVVTLTISIEFLDGTSSIDLNDIKVDITNSQRETGLVQLVDESFLDDESSSNQISSMIVMSNDQYLNQAGYQLSPFRFQVRGYASRYQLKYINGVEFNDQNRGVFNYSSIGALNDLTRNGDAVNYSNPSTFTYGNLGGSENINMRAADYARGGKITTSYTNRNYYARGMASYSTGLMDDGYALTVAVGGRYSDEGNIDGTFYNNASYALAVEKQWKGGNHRLSLTTFGSPVERGQQHATYQEIYDLVGDNLYNPDWGYQNGKKRNSRVVTAFDPTAILSHTWKINDKAKLTSGVGVHYQQYAQTALNWYDGSDPRPDYYRYLPSYYKDDPDAFEYYTNLWKSKDKSFTQVNWDQMFMVNELGNKTGNPSAKYMLEERINNMIETSFNSTFNLDMSDNSKLTAGIGLRTTNSMQYKKVKDLLGAGYALDIDKFSERDFPNNDIFIQNDLEYYEATGEARKAVKGDRFGYDFRLRINSANVWLQQEYKLNKFDIYYATKFTYTDFQRIGKMQNGRYPTSSLGRAKTHSFTDYALKTGLTYKFSGSHFLSANVSFQTEAPLPDNAYITPRLSSITRDLESAKIFSADISYVFSLPKFSGRVTAFQTNFFDMMLKKSYYDDSQKTFVHMSMQGVDVINRGFELGTSYSLDDNWSFDLMGTMAEYFYNNNPTGVISFENNRTPEDLDGENVYLKNYYVGGTPQIAGVLGVNYFNNFWFLNLKMNGAARNYVDIAPIRRLASNYSTINPNNPDEMDAYNKLTSQERYPSSYTVDFSLGKILFLPRGNRINVNLAFNNILNRRGIKTGGYEQGRIDVSKPDRFASKYFYMQGFNLFLNASYLF